LGGTVLPYIIWLYALQVLPASKTVVYMYGIPVAALAWSWLLLGTVPKLVSVLGGVFIVLGVVVIQRSGRPQVVL
jgi:drug/metabolite transporter (DMT)-like permease